jgi:hypothetical protein
VRIRGVADGNVFGSFHYQSVLGPEAHFPETPFDLIGVQKL